MGRADRDIQIQELHELFSGIEMAVLTDYRGLTVQELSDLRIKLRDVDARFKVVKNTLSIRAADGTPLEHVKGRFIGPVALLYTKSDPVGPAKVLVDFSKTNDRIEAIVGILSGKVIELAEIKMLAEMPNREKLIATALSSMNAPATNFVRTLSEVPASFVRVLGSIQRGKEAA
ncbi:MAG: 50S ribosomal protein L10 [bacterium]|nr:50S ribosomal protein L10 [bacterium]MDT8395872.1 50S ribosomal protein L10 [bacterium]